MRINPAAMALWSCLSLSVGCGGSDVSEAGPDLAQARAAVAGEVGTWTPSPPTSHLYLQTYAARLKSSGEVLSVAHNRAARYNPSSNTWRSASDVCAQSEGGVIELVPLSSGSALATVAYYNRRGGIYDWSFMVYTPATDTWSGHSGPTYATLPRPYTDHSFTVLSSGRFLQSGGVNRVGYVSPPTKEAAEYDPTTQVWTNVPSMNVARMGHRSVALNSNKVLTLGGGSDTAEVYDSAKKTWKLTPTPPFTGTPRLLFRLNSGQVLVFPAQSAASSTPVYLFDPYNNRWLAGPTLPMVDPVNATLLYSGEVLVTNDAGDAQVYDPAQGAWLAAAHGTDLYGTSSTLLSSGQVFRQGFNFNTQEGQGERFTR